MGNVARLSIDRGIPSDLTAVPARAREIEQQGYDGCWTGEIAHDPFLPLLLAAEHTSRLQLGTSIAVAFARNPMLIANLGWDLNSYSQGRFILGLGTQVQAHIEKRYGMPWSHPARRMQEFVAAVHRFAERDDARVADEGEQGFELRVGNVVGVDLVEANGRGSQPCGHRPFVTHRQKTRACSSSRTDAGDTSKRCTEPLASMSPIFGSVPPET